MAMVVPQGKELEGLQEVDDSGTGGSMEREGRVKQTGDTAQGGAAKERAAAKPASVYIGVGLPPVPGKIAERIRRWECVEMHELLPELLQKAEDGPEKTGGGAKGRK